MRGQSVVHTGSRKVRATTRPRRAARETGRPLWSIRLKLGARTWMKLGAPSLASATIGSALRLTEAVAIGTAPTSTTATAQIPRAPCTSTLGDQRAHTGTV